MTLFRVPYFKSKMVSWVTKSGRALPVVLTHHHPLNAGAVCRRSVCPAVQHVIGYPVAGKLGLALWTEYCSSRRDWGSSLKDVFQEAGNKSDRMFDMQIVCNNDKEI